MDHRKEAQELLIHYMDRVAKPGVHLGQDHHTELRLLVDHIIDAAVEKTRNSGAIKDLLH